MNTKDKSDYNKGGRKPKNDPAVHRYVVRFNDMDNAQFLTLFEQSGMRTKAHFITACLFGKPIKVIKIDKSAMNICAKLTEINAQIRAIGVNYNQVVKVLKGNFSERKALAFLFKLEKATLELVDLQKQLLVLMKQYEEQWLQK